MIIPTILEKDKDEIVKKLTIFKDRAQLIQIDIVEPGVFEGETYLGTEYLDTMGLECCIELDLMVLNPIKYIKDTPKAVKKVCANAKCENLEEFFMICANNGLISGLAINPDTDIARIKSFIDVTDYIEFITVDPGGQGRKFREDSLDRISDFTKNYPDIPLQVDGGVNFETMPKLMEKGVKNFVVGSAIFKSQDPATKFDNFKKKLNN